MNIRLLFILGLCAVLLIPLYFLSRNTDVAAAASEVMSACSQEAAKPACYEREVPKLLGSFTLEEVFSIVRFIREGDPSYQFCHVLAHQLGERMVAADPSAWVSLISRNPTDGLCSNGFIHGVIGGRFRAEVLDAQQAQALVPDFARACEPHDRWRPTPLDQAICYHGMGHLFTFITDADLVRGVSLCKQTVAASGSVGMERVCREGVFMQIYQPLEPDDFLLIEQMKEKPTKATHRRFCYDFSDSQDTGACIREGWPLYREELMAGSGIDAFCAMNPASEVDRCYEAVFSIIGRFSLNDRGGVDRACPFVMTNRQGQCYAVAAAAVLEEDRTDGAPALAICNAILDETQRSTCYDHLAARAPFIMGRGSKDLIRFCSQLPDPRRRECIAHGS